MTVECFGVYVLRGMKLIPSCPGPGCVEHRRADYVLTV